MTIGIEDRSGYPARAARPIRPGASGPWSM